MMDTFEILPRPPFRLAPTVRVLQRRPNSLVDRFEKGRYCRALPTPAGLRLLIVEDIGGVENPSVRVSVAGGPLSAEVERLLAITVARILGANADLLRFYQAAAGLQALQPVLSALRGLMPPRFPGFFEAILNAVVSQQISLGAAVAIAGRLIQRYGEGLEHEGQRYWAFPTAQAIATAPADDLRGLGLSARKAAVLRELAGLISSGELSVDSLERLSSQVAIETLIAYPGIGRWTAQVILLRGLGRLDVFPIGDVGARRGLGEIIGQPAPLTVTQEQAVLDLLGPVRGLLYFYAVGWRLMKQGLIEPASND